MLVVLLQLAWLDLTVQSAGAQEATDRVRLPLFRSNELEIAGATPKEFEFYLPRHVMAASGGQLHVLLRPAKEPVPNTALSVSWNHRILLLTNLSSRADALMSLQLALEPSWLRGLNTLAFEVVSLDTNATPLTALSRAGWSLRKSECYLEYAFTRPPFVPELARFPHTLAEERLLAPEPELTPTKTASLFTILLPGVGGMSHLRAAAILAARLGQLTYLKQTDWRVGPLESWKLESQVRHTVVVARREQLGGIELPLFVASALSALGPGQGMLAEFISGPPAREHRVVLMTGADEAGLELAALTAGSAPAMAALADNPAVLNQKPSLIAPGSDEVKPLSVDGLYQLQEVLLADHYGRQAAYLVPSGATLEQVRLLFNIWMELGRRLPTAPVLWPEVVTYHRGWLPPMERLQNRNVLAFGSVADWPLALPPNAARPALRMITVYDETVTIQGRRQKRSELEPTLAFAQLMPSPWSSTNLLVLIGGWRDYAIPATEQLLLSPATPPKLGGNLAAIDVLGRATSYELRHVASESFAERLRRMIPAGVGREETAKRTAAHESRRVSSQQWNRTLSAICGAILLLLVAARLILVGHQSRLRRRAFAAERATGGTA